MDSEEFRKYGKEMIDFVADYWDSLKVDQSPNHLAENQCKNILANKIKRKPLAEVKPGFIWDMIPREAPNLPESWETIFADLEPVILHGNTHWHHPNFFAYFPTSCSYPSIMGDILSGGIASIGFSWNSSPAMTELEMAMTDWLAKAIGLPDYFLNIKQGLGAGIIQSTASDATFVALLSARARAVDRIKSSPEYKNTVNDGNWIQFILHKGIGKIRIQDIVPQKLLNLKMFNTGNTQQKSKEIFDAEQSNKKDWKNINKEHNGPRIFRNHDPTIFQRFVAYCSDQAHSSVEKDVMLCGVHIRKLQSSKSENGNFTLEAETFEAALQEDKTKGFIPFVLIATIGTTNTCGVDNINFLGPICARENIWLHVDAAYAGSFLICDEFRYLLKGIEYVDSLNFNSHKAMMINFDCSPMWIKDATNSIEYFKVDPLYLRHAHQKDASDYRHLQIALGRRFRALKIWFVLRSFGMARIQETLRKQIALAKQFAMLIEDDAKFELFVPQYLGLVCFRLKGDNKLNEKLTEAINADGRIHLVPGMVHGVFFLRLAICSTITAETNILNAYKIIKKISEQITSVMCSS